MKQESMKLQDYLTPKMHDANVRRPTCSTFNSRCKAKESIQKKWRNQRYLIVLHQMLAHELASKTGRTPNDDVVRPRH